MASKLQRFLLFDINWFILYMYAYHALTLCKSQLSGYMQNCGQ